jgi:hypothetical protein|nr:MAG TPA: amidase effector protein 4 [Bacteriophage sp.]
MKKKFVAVLCSCMALQAVPVFAESEVETEAETSVDYEAKYNELLKDYNDLLKLYNELLEGDEEESSEAETEAELPDGDILFKDIPWGTNFASVQSLTPELNLQASIDQALPVYSVDDIIYGGITGVDYDSTGFMASAFASNYQQPAFGYTTSSVYAYFVCPSADGAIDYNVANAMLYGVTYEFNTNDVSPMANDLKEQLTATYGEPSQDYDEDSFSTKGGSFIFNLYDGHFTIWETKTCILSIHSCDYGKDAAAPSTIQINYAWKDASDILEQNDKIVSAQ